MGKSINTVILLNSSHNRMKNVPINGISVNIFYTFKLVTLTEQALLVIPPWGIYQPINTHADQLGLGALLGTDNS